MFPYRHLEASRRPDQTLPSPLTQQQYEDKVRKEAAEAQYKDEEPLRKARALEKEFWNAYERKDARTFAHIYTVADTQKYEGEYEDYVLSDITEFDRYMRTGIDLDDSTKVLLDYATVVRRI